MSGSQQTILLVEDNDFVSQYATYQLGLLGYYVISAEDGHAALEIIQTRASIDILFTDINLPGGMKGRELAIEARIIRPTLKVLYTSGYSSDEITCNSCCEAQNQLFNKPYTRQELALGIRRALEN